MRTLLLLLTLSACSSSSLKVETQGVWTGNLSNCHDTDVEGNLVILSVLTDVVSITVSGLSEVDPGDIVQCASREQFEIDRSSETIEGLAGTECNGEHFTFDVSLALSETSDGARTATGSVTITVPDGEQLVCDLTLTGAEASVF